MARKAGKRRRAETRRRPYRPMKRMETARRWRPGPMARKTRGRRRAGTRNSGARAKMMTGGTPGAKGRRGARMGKRSDARSFGRLAAPVNGSGRAADAAAMAPPARGDGREIRPVERADPAEAVVPLIAAPVPAAAVPAVVIMAIAAAEAAELNAPDKGQAPRRQERPSDDPGFSGVGQQRKGERERRETAASRVHINQAAR